MIHITFRFLFLVMLLLPAGGAVADAGNGVVLTPQEHGRIRVEYSEDVVWLAPPEGYCALDASQEWDRNYLENTVQSRQEGAETIITTFVACDDLRERRETAGQERVRYVDMATHLWRNGFAKARRRDKLIYLPTNAKAVVWSMNRTMVQWHESRGDVVDKSVPLVQLVDAMVDQDRWVSHLGMRYRGLPEDMMLMSVFFIDRTPYSLYHSFPHAPDAQWGENLAQVERYVRQLRKMNHAGEDGSVAGY